MIMTTDTRSAQTNQPGALMAAEIAEQPQVWRGLLAASRGTSSDIARPPR